MAFWFNRYKNYTKRGEVYLFTLKDYCEIMLIKQFGGTYLVRKDMPMKAGYLMQFPSDQIDRLTTFVKGEINSSSMDSLIAGSKIFQLNAIEKSFEADGATNAIQLSSHPLTANASDFVVTVTADGVTSPLTPTISDGVVTLKNASNTVKATVYTADGIVKFGADPASPTAPESGEVWNFQVKEIAYKLNYQLLGNTVYAGLSPADAPNEIAVSNVDLGADESEKVFQLAKNLKKGTVQITFKLAEDGDAIGPLTDSDGVFSVTTNDVTTTYGTVDYASGVLTMANAPYSLSYSASYYEAQ